MDELQDIWDAHQDNVGKQQHLEESEIKQQLRGKSNDALGKISRIMKMDVILMTIVTALFIMVTFIINLERRYSVSFVLFTTMMILAIHYWMKHHLIHKHDLDNDNIAEIIGKKLKVLKWNKQIYITAIPLFFSGLFLHFQQVLAVAMSNPQSWQMYTLGLVMTILIFFFSKWLHHFLYGKEIKLLEDIMEQLD
jgi:uncharacterized membrane protein